MYIRNNNFGQPFTGGGSRVDVPDNQSISMVVCNYGNVNGNNVTVDLGRSLIPFMVGNVGRNAQVRVDIINSGNMHVSERLVLGMQIAEGELTGDFPDAALVSEIVQGQFGAGAEVYVNIKDSANVEITGQYTEVWIGKGSLLQEVINVEPRQRIDGVCFDVLVESSANIYQRNNFSGVRDGKVYIRDGQLDEYVFIQLLLFSSFCKAVFFYNRIFLITAFRLSCAAPVKPSTCLVKSKTTLGFLVPMAPTVMVLASNRGEHAATSNLLELLEIKCRPWTLLDLPGSRAEPAILTAKEEVTTAKHGGPHTSTAIASLVTLPHRATMETKWHPARKGPLIFTTDAYVRAISQILPD
jgi:hypothetical protein